MGGMNRSCVLSMTTFCLFLGSASNWTPSRFRTPSGTPKKTFLYFSTLVYKLFIFSQKDRNFLYFYSNSKNCITQMIPLSFSPQDQETHLKSFNFTISQNYLFCLIESEQTPFIATFNTSGDRVSLFKTEPFHSYFRSKNYENLLFLASPHSLTLVDLLKGLQIASFAHSILDLDTRFLTEFSIVDATGKIVNLDWTKEHPLVYEQNETFEKIQWNETGTLLASLS